MPPRGKKKAAAEAAATAETPMDAWVARARGAGALIGFAIAFWICRRQGFPMTDAVLRGLIGAVALSLVSWWSALLVIQALMRAAAVQTTAESYAAAQAQAHAHAQAQAQAAATRAAPPGAEAS